MFQRILTLYLALFLKLLRKQIIINNHNFNIFFINFHPICLENQYNTYTVPRLLSEFQLLDIAWQ